MISILFKPQILNQLYSLVIINISFIYKHSKGIEKILEIRELIYYLSHIFLIFFNVL